MTVMSYSLTDIKAWCSPKKLLLPLAQSLFLLGSYLWEPPIHAGVNPKFSAAAPQKSVGGGAIGAAETCDSIIGDH